MPKNISMSIFEKELFQYCKYFCHILFAVVTFWGKETYKMFFPVEILVSFHLTVAWLVWLSELISGLWTKGPPVQFPVTAHAWVVGQAPSRGHARGNYTLMLLSLPSFSLSLKLRGKGLLEGREVLGWGRQRGRKWDNYNSIINKIYFKILKNK